MGTILDISFNRISAGQFIWTFLTCWIISSFNGGFVTLLPYSSWVEVYIIWFVLSVIFNKKFLVYFIKTGYLIIIFVIMVILFSVYDSSAINVTSRSFMGILVMYSIFCYLKTSKHKGLIVIVVCFYFFEILCQFAYAVITLSSYPVLIRQLLTSTVDGREYPFMISFAGVYVALSIMLYIIIQFRNIKWKYRGPLILIVILQIIVIYMSNLATPLIIAGIFIILSLFIKSRKKLLMILITGGISFTLFKENIGELFILAAKSDYFSIIITDKLYELGYNLQGILIDNANASFATRQELSALSMSSFYEHFLLGVYGMGYGVSVGGHTTWQDMLGNFGIVRSSLLILFIYQWYRRLNENSKSETQKNAIFYSVLVIIVAGFFNPIIKLGIVTFIFLIMPLCEGVICKITKDKEVENEKDYIENNKSILSNKKPNFI